MKLKALNLSHSLLSSLLFFSTKKHIRCLESILWRESRALPLNFIAMRSLLWQPDPLTAPRRLAEWMNEWMGWLYPRLFAVAGGINDETRPVMSADEAPTAWTRWNDKKKKWKHGRGVRRSRRSPVITMDASDLDYVPPLYKYLPFLFFSNILLVKNNILMRWRLKATKLCKVQYYCQPKNRFRTKNHKVW